MDNVGRTSQAYYRIYIHEIIYIQVMGKGVFIEGVNSGENNTGGVTNVEREMGMDGDVPLPVFWVLCLYAFLDPQL